MNKLKIYVCEPKEINKEALELLEKEYEVVLGDKELKENFDSDCEILMVRSGVNVNQEVLNKFGNLHYVIRVGVGLDNVDTKLCAERGIKVFNSPGSNANAVAEYVVGIVLFRLRKFDLLTRKDIEEWNRFKFMGGELKGKIIGLVGFGNIAKLVYKKLLAFDCRFIVYDPYIDNSQKFESLEFTESLESLFKDSDIISIHVPLIDETFHLVDEALLGLMKDGVILVNTSRGPIVNEEKVIEMFFGRKSTYIADVFENEPNVSKKLLNHPNVICTPHIASMTWEADRMMAVKAAENFLTIKKS